MRFLAIESMHPPHLLGHTLWDGAHEEPLERLPRRASGFRQGLALSYVIEFLSEQGEVDFRVFYQDAATDEPVGFPPKSTRPVDVLIPCVASFNVVTGHPESLLDATDPAHVVLGHWEDFFRPYTQKRSELRRLRQTDVARFIEKLGPDASFTLPAPGSRVLYQRCPGAP